MISGARNIRGTSPGRQRPSAASTVPLAVCPNVLRRRVLCVLSFAGNECLPWASLLGSVVVSDNGALDISVTGSWLWAPKLEPAWGQDAGRGLPLCYVSSHFSELWEGSWSKRSRAIGSFCAHMGGSLRQSREKTSKRCLGWH